MLGSQNWLDRIDWPAILSLVNLMMGDGGEKDPSPKEKQIHSIVERCWKKKKRRERRRRGRSEEERREE